MATKRRTRTPEQREKWNAYCREWRKNNPEKQRDILDRQAARRVERLQLDDRTNSQ